MKCFISIIACSLVLSGCTSLWELRYGKEKPQIGVVFLTDEGKRDGIYAWKPDTAAAVGLSVYARDGKGDVTFAKNHDGTEVPLYEQKTCVMSAAAIKSRDSEGGVTINVTPPAGATGGEVSAIVRELQKVTTLANKSEAATYLDVALFGICVATMNGFIDKSEARGLMADAILKSSTIANGVNQIKSNTVQSAVPASAAASVPNDSGGITISPVRPVLPLNSQIDEKPKLEKDGVRPGLAPGAQGTAPGK